MERRAARVSEAQWNILLDFLEQNPSLARARGYNNSAQGRAESARKWMEVAQLLNAEGTGATKTPKDWSIYVSNYKSKLKKIAADINVDATSTGGGPPLATTLSETEQRFLALMGHGLGHNAPGVSVNPLPNMVSQQPALTATDMPQFLQVDIVEEPETAAIENPHHTDHNYVDNIAPGPSEVDMSAPISEEVGPPPVHVPHQTRRQRYRSRPLAPLDEACRILSQVEMQRAAADAASARALALIGRNLGRIADALELYLAANRSKVYFLYVICNVFVSNEK